MKTKILILTFILLFAKKTSIHEYSDKRVVIEKLFGPNDRPLIIPFAPIVNDTCVFNLEKYQSLIIEFEKSENFLFLNKKYFFEKKKMLFRFPGVYRFFIQGDSLSQPYYFIVKKNKTIAKK